MTTGSIQIHSENLLPIIKRWLYSDREIFIRELVSNACDALLKIKMLRDRGEAAISDDELRVDIRIDEKAQTLTISDTGIGMTAEEVEKYIAQLAFSGAEEFLKKYEDKSEQDQIIGHFGLGFYSAYMVSKLVEIQTLSYQEGAKPVYWSCDGGSTYSIEEGSRKSRGTDIILSINEDNKDYLESATIRGLLRKYCAFLPYPVYLNDSKINDHEPLWMKAPSECTDKDYIDFYHHLYPMQGDPLFWVHLNVDYPFHLKGILYFPKLPKHYHMPKDSVHLYCNRVFVSENCKDVLPEYLMMLKGVIDSPDIPLNVSRSQLQSDRTVKQVASHVSKKVSDRLSSLYKSDREAFLKNWEDVGFIIKIGAIEDSKFYDRVKGFLTWQTVDGEWVTAEDYLEQHKEKCPGKIYYCTDEGSSFINLYKDKGITVLKALSPVDTALMQTIEQKLDQAKFQRIDAELEENLLDKSKEKNVLDAEGKTEAGRIADLFRKELKEESTLEVEAKSLASESLPAMLVFDENMRRLRDHFKLQGEEAPIPCKATFVLNTNHPLVQMIHKLQASDPQTASHLSKQLYQLTKLSQRELEAKDLASFVQESHALLTKLVEKNL